MNLKDRLRGKLSDEELNKVIRSFEIIGDVAIIQVPEELESKKHVIAEAVKDQHKRIKTVLRKIKEVETEYRVPEYEILLGNETETIHKENKCRFKLDIRKVYFTEKLSGERWRIVQQIKDNEKIYAWFCGVGPYPIEIAKNRRVEIYAIEKNPIAFSYLKENIKLNKVNSIKPFLGDVAEVVERINEKVDRILMPLPKASFDFLDLALKYIKDGGIIHFYVFSEETKIEDVKERLKEKAMEKGKRIEIMNVVRCGNYSPGIYRYCIDFKVVG